MYVHASSFLQQPPDRLPPRVFRIRILYMPPVYAVISFLSFRFFRSYTYYALAETGELTLFIFWNSPASMFRVVYEVRGDESFSEK